MGVVLDDAGEKNDNAVGDPEEALALVVERFAVA